MANGSKYIKDKGEGSNSKYLRDKDNHSPHSRYSRENTSPDGLSGRARYLEMLEREQEMKDTLEILEGDYTASERIKKREEAKKEAAKKEAAKRAAEHKDTREKKAAKKLTLTRDGDGTNVAFSSNTPTVEAKPLANEDEDEKVYRKVILRNIITCGILCVIAFVFQIANFRLPLMPGMTKIDFSAVPELIAAVAFGPIAGVSIIIIKNALYVLIFQTTVLSSAISNVIIDSVFVFTASAIYARGVFSPMAIERQMMQRREDPDNVKDPRGRSIFMGGLLGAIITTPISYFAATYIVYPLIFRWYGSKGYTEEYYVMLYNDALRALNSHLPAPLNGIITEITTLSDRKSVV